MLFSTILLFVASPLGAITKGAALFLSAYFLGHSCRVIYKDYKKGQRW